MGPREKKAEAIAAPDRGTEEGTEEGMEAEELSEPDEGVEQGTETEKDSKKKGRVRTNGRKKANQGNIYPWHFFALQSTVCRMLNAAHHSRITWNLDVRLQRLRTSYRRQIPSPGAPQDSQTDSLGLYTHAGADVKRHGRSISKCRQRRLRPIPLDHGRFVEEHECTC